MPETTGKDIDRHDSIADVQEDDEATPVGSIQLVNEKTEL